MKTLTYYTTFFLSSILLVVNLSSCQKIDEWLDAKGTLNEVRPSTLADYQAILDNNYWMNNAFPRGGALGADNYYLSDNQFNSVSQHERNSYIFASDIYTGEVGQDWNDAYRVVEFANIVLDGLSNLAANESNRADFNNIKGSAYFFRAFAYYMLSQIYCASYDVATDNSGLGLVLRTSSDVNQPSVRSTVTETYDFMINDIMQAIELLPGYSPYQTRPTRPAANALLAKVYLSMENYAEAYSYANNCLAEFNTLLDYNSDLISLNSTFRFPVMPGNPEILFFAQQIGSNPLFTGGFGVGNIDTLLYASYHENDLRKALYYGDNGSGLIKLIGTYSGDFYTFCGIATNEVLLIRAECAARLGNPSGAITDLNTLLTNRYNQGTYQPFDTNLEAENALCVVLDERRKELAFTGQLRWEDLRRLNKDERFAKTIYRIINGTTYSLPPNDKRYVYPIPDDEIALSGIQQNER